MIKITVIGVFEMMPVFATVWTVNGASVRYLCPTFGYSGKAVTHRMTELIATHASYGPTHEISGVGRDIIGTTLRYYITPAGIVLVRSTYGADKTL